MIEFVKDNFIWIAGIVTALKWTYEYSQKLRWDRSKLLLDRLEAFLAKESTKKVHLLLDWNSIEIEVGGKMVFVDDDLLYEALMTHDVKKQYNTLELELRRVFDEYFDGLTEFLILSECGLISKADFRKFNSYWIEILSGASKRKPSALQEKFDTYLIFYGFGKLHKFIHAKSPLKRFRLA